MNRVIARLGAALVRGAVVLGALVGAADAGGALPPRGSDAPPIRLKDLDGTLVSTKDLSSRTLVLVFGEFGHDGVKQACSDVMDVLADARVEPGSVVPIMIVAQDTEPTRLKEEAAQGRFPAIVLQDPKRDAFGAYRVLVVPTVVVVDGHAKVTYAMPGFVPRFKEILAEAVLVAAGKHAVEKLDQLVDAGAAPHASPEATRAARLVKLGGELARHGLFEMAEARYAEAIALAPDSVEAKLGLGELMLKQSRLGDAEPFFKSILTNHPDSLEAILGLAAVRVERGDEELALAEGSVRGVIEKSPSNARAHYLLGRIREKGGDAAGASCEYRKAAELLLAR
ncbi:hypothetical protein PHYC_00726 [Phycisphaerales bacterium]|nr:hypothetical protein PHYC_00726 [Phycisphaerales bacterium]